MNYKTFLIRFNLNPNDFVDKEPIVIKNDDTIIYVLVQKITEMLRFLYLICMTDTIIATRNIFQMILLL